MSDDETIEELHARWVSAEGRARLIADLQSAARTWFTRSMLVTNREASSEATEVAQRLEELARALGEGALVPRKNPPKTDAKDWLLNVTEHVLKRGVGTPAWDMPFTLAVSWAQVVRRAFPSYRASLQQLMPRLRMAESVEEPMQPRDGPFGELAEEFRRILDGTPEGRTPDREKVVRGALRVLGCTERDPLSYLDQRKRRE